MTEHVFAVGQMVRWNASGRAYFERGNGATLSMHRALVDGARVEGLVLGGAVFMDEHRWEIRTDWLEPCVPPAVEPAPVTPQPTEKPRTCSRCLGSVAALLTLPCTCGEPVQLEPTSFSPVWVSRVGGEWRVWLIEVTGRERWWKAEGHGFTRCAPTVELAAEEWRKAVKP